MSARSLTATSSSRMIQPFPSATNNTRHLRARGSTSSKKYVPSVDVSCFSMFASHLFLARVGGRGGNAYSVDGKRQLRVLIKIFRVGNQPGKSSVPLKTARGTRITSSCCYCRLYSQWRATTKRAPGGTLTTPFRAVCRNATT